MTYIIVDDVTKARREEERSEEKGERRKEGKRGKREEGILDVFRISPARAPSLIGKILPVCLFCIFCCHMTFT